MEPITILQGVAATTTIARNFRDYKQKKEQEEKLKKAAVGAVIASVVGISFALLIAPKSGKETREELAKVARTAIDHAKAKDEEMKKEIKPI